MASSYRSLSLVVCLLTMAGCAATTRRAVESPRPVDAAEESPRGKSYAIPVFEVIGFEAALNLVDRQLYRNSEFDGAFDVTPSSVRRNLRGPWVVDDDAYEVNQFLHPYQGSIYYGLARSAGLNYWQSLAYSFGGSALWEIAGETTKPSKNDQIASGIAGSFFGESLFRTANLLIDKAGGHPGRGRSLLVAIISPPTAFNRIVGGQRFDGVVETFDPMYDARMEFGTSGLLRHASGGSPVRLLRDESLLNFSLEYGLPGQTGYSYRRPFDYFKFQATASSENGLESVTSHGLLVGSSYRAGDTGRGVWGLFAVYDYLSPQLFRVSTTAVSVGATTQWWSAHGVGVQTTAHAGIGWAAAQTLSDVDDYHYGLAPQGALAFRLTGGDRISIDLTGRGYLVSDVGGYPTPDNDVILRGDASFAVRLKGRAAVSIRYLFNQRVTSLPDLTTTRQKRETVGLYFTLLGPQGFGASRWKQ